MATIPELLKATEERDHKDFLYYTFSRTTNHKVEVYVSNKLKMEAYNRCTFVLSL